MDRDKMAERLLHLTLEILFRLTGENYTIVKKTSSEHCQASVSEGRERNLSPILGPPPHPLIHGDINDQKILELTYKMIELLTGEVPIRCQDVTIYFSMEEWEYLEGHKDLYKDVIMTETQPLTSPDDCIRRLTRNPILSDFKAADCGTIQNTNEEHVTIPDIPSALHRDLSCDTFKHVIPSDSSQTVKQSKSPRIGNDHQRAHAGQKPYSLLDYEKSYNTAEKTISESEYGKYCSSKPSLEKHQRIQGLLKPFLCSDCGKCYNHKSQLVRHQKSHTGEKQFSCVQCGKGFNQKSDLVRHQRSHTEAKPFSCSECGKSFKDKYSVVIHQRIHTGEKPFSCSECGKLFSVKSTFVAHQKMHTGNKPFSCSECGKCFIEKLRLVRHQKIHTIVKPFSCSECGKSFIEKLCLVRHQRIHTGEKPYSCLECGNSYNQKSDLVRHERSHTGENPFSCSECGKYFSCKSTFVTHQRNHTGEKPFLCSECGKCFTVKFRLVRHQRIHTKEKPF
ncbi:uncharacterized protein [Dendrobates tinctorius]|uniref:uncharacterized protein isoform X1 n=1 Tax=Dendrobates tinctorius TaxID=92724 RepID=UPI003CC96CEB